MKVSIYSPAGRPDSSAISELLQHIPEDAEVVLIQAPPRRPIDLRACQRPGHLEYVATCDNKVFIFLSQPMVSGPYTIKVTT